MKLQKTIIFSTLLLDIIGIAIMIPAFPELKAYYGIGDFQVTLGLTIYSLFAFLSAPLLGQISDKIGRKKSLVRCVFGTMISYIVLLVTKQYRVFLLSRVVNGITGGNISILQAILTDISPDKQTKSKNFGLMGALFGLGFIIGPVIGALLLRFGNGVHTIFEFGAVFSLVELILTAAYFTNTNTLNHAKELTYNSFVVMKKYLKRPAIRYILISLCFLGIGGFTVNATQGLYMQGLFGTTGEQYGYILAILGIISAVNLGYLVPKFWTKKFSNKQLIIFCHLVLIIGYTIVGMITHLPTYLFFFYLTVLLSGTYTTVYNIEVMSKALPHEVGEISGMLGGAQSLFMFVGPLIGGILLTYHFNIFWGAALCFAVSFAVMLKFFSLKTPNSN